MDLFATRASTKISLYVCQFLGTWHGSKMHLKIPGVISELMHFPLFGFVKSDAFEKFLLSSGHSHLASEGVVHRSSGSSDGRNSWASLVSHSSGSFTEAWKCRVFMPESYQETHRQG